MDTAMNLYHSEAMKKVIDEVENINTTFANSLIVVAKGGISTMIKGEYGFLPQALFETATIIASGGSITNVLNKIGLVVLKNVMDVTGVISIWNGIVNFSEGAGLFDKVNNARIAIEAYIVAENAKKVLESKYKAMPDLVKEQQLVDLIDAANTYLTCAKVAYDKAYDVYKNEDAPSVKRALAIERNNMSEDINRFISYIYTLFNYQGPIKP